MPIAAAAGRPPAWGTPAWGTPAWRAPAPLTRRRTVDYCRVATALCPGPPRRRQTAWSPVTPAGPSQAGEAAW